MMKLARFSRWIQKDIYSQWDLLLFTLMFILVKNHGTLVAILVALIWLAIGTFIMLPLERKANIADRESK